MSTPQDPPHQKDLTLWENLRILFGASRAFWLVNMVNFTDGIAYFGILTLMTRYLGEDLGMSDQATGFAVSAFTGLVTLLMFGGGFISDRLGVRKAMTVSVAMLALGRVFLTMLPSLEGDRLVLVGGVWVSLLLMALGSGIIQPALYAGVKEFTDPRTATIGYSLLYSIMNLGIVAENFLSPYVRSDEVFLTLGSWQIHGLGWGIQGVYAVCSLMTVLVLLAHLALFSRRVEEEDRQVTPEEEARETEAAAGGRLHPLMDARFLFFIFILLPVRTLFAHQWLTLPDYVFRCFSGDVSAKFEWISGLNPLIIVIFVPLIAAMTRRARVIDMMLVGTALSAVSTFLLVPGPDLTALLTYVILFSLGEAVWSSRFLEYVADLAPAGQVGAYMGLAGVPWFLAKFTTGLYSGWMLARFIPESGPQDSETLWLIYALIACLTPVGLLLARGWLLKGEHPPR